MALDAVEAEERLPRKRSYACRVLTTPSAWGLHDVDHAVVAAGRGALRLRSLAV